MPAKNTNRPPVSDHKKKKAKATKVQKSVALNQPIEVKVDGKAWSIKPSAVDDFELLEDLDAIDSGDPARIPKVMRRLLGNEQYAAAIEALRGKNGVVSIEHAAKFFYKIVEAINPN